MRITLIVFAACALFVGVGGALGQTITIDDAGDTFATAGQLHLGVNQCRFDYKLPRAMDVDVWSFPTQPGRLYRMVCTPIDDLSESFAALPLNQSFSRADALSTLGFGDAVWMRGNGNPIVRTCTGLARSDGQPLRYTIELTEVADPGDAEGDDLAHAVPLSVDEWHQGAFSPPSPVAQPATTVYTQAGYDVDAFTFPFEDRAVYQFELEVNDAYAGLASPQWRGVASQSTAYVAFATPSSLAFSDTIIECRGSGVAWFTLAGGLTDLPSRGYRVRVHRIGTAPPDDHGDTPAQATSLTVGGAPARAELSSRAIAAPTNRTISDPDWFSVQTLPGHAYEARVERSPVSLYTPAIIDVLSEDGQHRADAMVDFQQLAPNTNLLASVRFSGRAGAPVKFGLVGTGNVTVAVTDLGVVTDTVGDPLTGPAVLSLAQPPIAGQLENPRDVDSFIIDPPAAAGVYRINYNVQWQASSTAGVAPGFALTTRTSRTGQFHISHGSISLTRRTDGTADSFPARLDLLNKAWPSVQYPATGPVINYTLSLEYVGPLPTAQPPSPDDAPPGFEGSQLLQPGEFVQFQRQGTADDADAVRVPLLAGRFYAMGADSSSGEIVAPDGGIITPTLAENGGSSRRFTVSRDGVYLQRQRYNRTIPLNYSPISLFAAGVQLVGVANDDQTNDMQARHLGVGTVSGSIDYPGDADQFVLPYDAGGFYRVTVHSAVPFTIFDGQESFFQQDAGDKQLSVYFPPTPVTAEGKRFAVASLSQTHGQYQVTVEKLLQLHPGDDLPDQPGVRAPINAGESAWVVMDHPFDVDVLEFRVVAGHFYNLRYEPFGVGVEPTTDWSRVLDESGAEVRMFGSPSPIRAEHDGVWHVSYDTPQIQPARVVVVDIGVGEDDIGTGAATAGLLHVGQTVSGLLETIEDVDLWVVDDAVPVPPGMAARMTRVNLDAGTSVVWEDTLEVPSSVQMFSQFMPGGGVFPMRYSLTVELVPYTPPAPVGPCVPDLGKAGGRLGADGRLDNNDMVAFITYFFLNNTRADIGGPGGVPGRDGWLDSNDFVAFINLFFAGCP